MNPGDRVLVIVGPYTGWEGRVVTVQAMPDRVTVNLQVFGKETVIALSAGEVQVL